MVDQFSCGLERAEWKVTVIPHPLCQPVVVVGSLWSRSASGAVGAAKAFESSGCAPVCAATRSVRSCGLVQGAGTFTSLVQYPDLMCFSVISVLDWRTWDQAPGVVHSPGFRVGCTLSCTLYRVQTRCLVNMHFFQCLTSLSCHLPFWSRERGSTFVIALLQPWLSTHDTGATSQFSSGSICAANPSPLRARAFPFMKWAPLYSGVFVTHVIVGTQSSVVFTWTNIFWPGIRVGFASWAHFGVTYGACAHRNCDNDLTLSSENIFSFTFLFSFSWGWPLLMIHLNAAYGFGSDWWCYETWYSYLSLAKLFKLPISCELSYLDCWFSSTYWAAR